MSESPFRGRAVLAIVVVCVASFALGLVLSAFGERTDGISGGADGYSPSAVGHLGLVRLLEAVGIPVIQGRHESARRAGPDGVLLVLEPEVASDAESRRPALDALLEEAPRVLVALPKWEGGDGPFPGWASSVDLKPESEVRAVLAAFGGGDLRRRSGVPRAWPTNEIGAEPVLSRDVAQLVAPQGGDVLLGGPEGALVLEQREGDSHRILLADPEILCNAGLHRGQNAALVLSLIDRLRRGDGPVVIDETLHGYSSPPGLAREVLSPPLVYALAHGLLCLLLVVGTAGSRFGAPSRSTPPLEPGTRALIGTTADLLRAGGHAPLVLPRYLAGVLEAVRHALHAPPRLEGAALDAWLDRVAEKRGAGARVRDLREAVRRAVAPPVVGARVLATAARIDRWRGAMLGRGPSSAPTGG